jgi:hypothetical protein
MRKTMLGAALAAVVMLGTAVPADAQHWRFDIGVNGGWAHWTPLLHNDALTPNADNVRFQSGWIAGAQGTFWAARRLGVRGNFSYAYRPLVGDNYRLTTFPATTTVEFNERVNLWSGSGDLMLRLADPAAGFVPYVALGVGSKWINPSGDQFIDAEGRGLAFVGTTVTAPTEAYMLQERRQLMGLAALGGDLRIAPNFAVRLEVGDRFFQSPMTRLTAVDVQTQPGVFVRATAQEDVRRLVHEIYGTAGIHLLLGVEPPVVVAIAPPPPPPAPPPPPPPAPPAEESVMVCVIDPAAPGGIRMVQAAFRPATRDTVVTVDGQRVALRTTIGTVPTAAGADWFVQGRPLAVMTTPQRVEFVTYGTARMVESSDLTFLGTVNGVPVYGDRTQVAALGTELADLHRTQATTDLGTLLATRTQLRQRVAGVDILYVPMQPTGCVFQPVQRVEDVRK